MSRDTGHTPGPWYVDDDSDEIEIVATGLKGCSRFGVDGEWEVASIEDDDFISFAQRLANARLIAAAPSLLAALEALDAHWLEAGWMPPNPDPSQQERRVLSAETLDIWRVIRAAISKARTTVEAGQ